jgi:hypothetical protein
MRRRNPVRRTIRSSSAVFLGFVIGLLIGPISVFAINARDVLRSNEEWPEWTSKYLLLLLVTSIPAGISGAIGALVAQRRGNLDWRPVSILPAILHVIVGVGALIKEPQSFMGFQLYTLVFTAVIWSAGRIGQRIGCGFADTGQHQVK